MAIVTLGTISASLNPLASPILMTVRSARGLLSVPTRVLLLAGAVTLCRHRRDGRRAARAEVPVRGFGDHPTLPVETLPAFVGCHNSGCSEFVLISPEAATTTMVKSTGQAGFGAIQNLAPAPPTQQIFVKSLTGATVTVDITDHDVVGGVKLQILAKTRIPPELYSLSFAGKQLEDAQPLTVYGIQKESTLHLALRLRGGMGKRPPQQPWLPPQRIRGSVNVDPSWQAAPLRPIGELLSPETVSALRTRLQRHISELHTQLAAQAREIKGLQTAVVAAWSVGSEEDMEIVPIPPGVEQPQTELDRAGLEADLTQLQSAASAIEGIERTEEVHTKLRCYAEELKLRLNPDYAYSWRRACLLDAIQRREEVRREQLEAADNARKRLAAAETTVLRLDAEIATLERALPALEGDGPGTGDPRDDARSGCLWPQRPQQQQPPSFGPDSEYPAASYAADVPVSNTRTAPY